MRRQKKTGSSPRTTAHRRRWLRWGTAIAVTSVAVALSARPAIVTYRLVRAQSALTTHDTATAIHWLDAAERLSPNRPDIAMWLARANRRAGAYDNAQKSLDQAARLGLAPDAVRREQLLIDVQSGLLSPVTPEATAMLVNPGPDSLEIYDAFVRACLDTFQIAMADRLLDGWESDFPADVQPHYYRGLVEAYDGQWHEAAAAFRKALHLDPGRRDVRLQLAKSLRELYQFREAASEYRECLRQHRDADGLRGLGICLYRLGDTGQARKVLHDLLQDSPKDYEALVTLGEMEVTLGHGSEGLPYLRTAVELRPDEFKAQQFLAWALVFSGRKPEARTHFAAAGKAQVVAMRVRSLTNQAITEPDSVEIRYRLGSLLMENGQAETGVAWLRGALALNPSHEPTQRLLNPRKPGN